MRPALLSCLLALISVEALAAPEPSPTLAEMLPRLGTDLDSLGRFPDVVDPLLYHFACVAVTSGSADACAGLAAAAIRPGGMTMESNCRRRYAEAVLARTLLRREPGETACADLLQAVGVEAASKRRELCGRIIAGPDSDKAVCQELAAVPEREEPGIDGCITALRIVRGTPVDCGRLVGQGYQEQDLIICRAVQALREQERAPGADACARQPLCRAMAGLSPDRCGDYAELARKAFSARIDMASDVWPQPFDPRYKPEAAGVPAASTHVFTAKMDYPYVVDGEIRPPRRYGVEQSLPPADVEKLGLALRTAHLYADVTMAAADGYRRAARSDLGQGVHLLNPTLVMNDEVAVDKPEFLTYHRDPKTGTYQLVQLGYIRRGRRRANLFESPLAQGEFSSDPGGLDAGPVWVLHLAVSLYNPGGLFARDHAYKGKAYSFYGRKPAP